MAQSGEYVFFSIELFTSKSETRRPWWREDDPLRNHRAKKAYEALLQVTARVPDTNEYSKFARTVKEIAKDKFGFDYKQEESASIEAVVVRRMVHT
ncbi:atrial natriuretic peptide receptor 1-like protein [Leptotrombidium deliense]|uniref:Atrial natriuretic peptide receptor 1-like protein n=1 Tax=Leptotrombidium deliense TaxID=299467 RepID=A0A443SG68_9ACAR|nr:atrial natriuretic peptide receptor 1-like protein [Leptotrombidium deliense]